MYQRNGGLLVSAVFVFDVETLPLIADLKNITKVVKKAKERLSKLIYSKIAKKSNLIVIRIGDTSFNIDDKAVGGIILLLANMAMTHAVPIYWKSKPITRVCYSSKDLETINLI